MTYFAHLKKNWAAAWRCFVLLVFHFVHGLIPVKWTEHEHWGIPQKKDVE